MWRMRQNVSEGFEDIEGFEKLKTSIPSFCVLRIYLLIFSEIDFFYEFPRTFISGNECVRGNKKSNCKLLIIKGCLCFTLMGILGI